MLKKIFVIVFCLTCFDTFSFVQAQIINTIAGNGVAGYSGDGVPATSTSIHQPIGIFVDGANNLYIADQQNNRIRKVNSSGMISTIAGNGTPSFSGDGGSATLATIHTPGGVFVDAVGNVYFADGLNHRVRMINTSGNISTIAGNGTPSYSGDGGQATSAGLYNPIGVYKDGSGNLYIADQRNNRIRKVSPTGVISTIAGNGTGTYTGDGGPATAATIYYPNYVHVDGTGNVFFTDNGNHCIRKINTLGVISTVAGTGTGGFSGDGGPATSAQLYYPGGVTLDGLGNLYIADYGNNRIRKVTSSGIISTIAGTGLGSYSGDGGLAISAELYNPVDLAYDMSGNLRIADYNNNRIRIIGQTNHPPIFTAGASANLTVCLNELPTSIDSLLPVLDSDISQTLTWSIVTSPTHGTVVASYSAPSTGSVVMTTGLTYLPMPGYSGSDMFSVRVSDGFASDTITINVVDNLMPNAGVISGIDSVCPGAVVHLSETVTLGIWSYSNGAKTTITSSGDVTGVAPGVDTIIYTVINSCGIASAIFPFIVRSYAECHTGVNNISLNNDNIIYPNPSHGKFTLNISSAKANEAKIIISNCVGQKIEELTVSTNKPTEVQLDVTPGVYFVEVINDMGKSNQKLIITR